MSPNRHQEMEIVRERLANEFLVFRQSFRYAPSDSEYFNLLSKRFSEKDRPVLRGYFVDLLRRYIENETGESVQLPEEIKSTVLPFLSELLIAVMYYDNQILDRKAGVVTHDKQCHNLIQSNLLLAEIWNYIENRVQNREIKDKVMLLARDIYAAVNVGQDMERRCNHFKNWKENTDSPLNYHFLPFDNEAIGTAQNIVEEVLKTNGRIDFPPEKLPFLCGYLSRIYLTNAYLFVRFTTFLFDFLPENVSCKNDILRFAALSGIMYQMVNDVIDFVPSKLNPGTKTKHSSDALSDLKNKNITLPLQIHLLKNQTGEIENYLYAKHFSLNFKNEMDMVEEILKSGAIHQAQEIGKIMRRKSVALLNPQNPAFDTLKDASSMAEGNVFYNKLKKIQKNLPRKTDTQTHPTASKPIIYERTRHPTQQNEKETNQKRASQFA